MRHHDLAFVLAVMVMLAPGVWAQEAIIQFSVPGGGGQPIVVGPDGKPLMVPGSFPTPNGAFPSAPARPMLPQAVQGDDKPQEAGADKEKQGPEGEAKVLTRPDKPPMPADPDELNARPDGDGMVRFNFRYQTWPDVLDWLADVSQMSLDWQELPKDFLNLTTQREYTVVETRDLINRHLLARGFTLLENGEVLSVVATAKLNPAMVPRIRAEDLDQLVGEQPYKFVKVSFSLDWLLAEQAAGELAPMLSSNGKLVPLTTTNRIEGMDAAINLHEINTLLQQEQSNTGASPLVSEFVLIHARAADVLDDLESLLGLDSNRASAGSLAANQMQAMQQQQMQQMQQMAQQNGQRAPVAAKKEVAVKLVVNKRKNSILAHAPPDKMAIIGQAIEALDVRMDRTDSLLAKPHQMEIYRLNNLGTSNSIPVGPAARPRKRAIAIPFALMPTYKTTCCCYGQTNRKLKPCCNSW